MREEGTRPASLSRKRYRFRSAELAALFDVTWKRKKRLQDDRRTRHARRRANLLIDSGRHARI